MLFGLIPKGKTYWVATVYGPDGKEKSVTRYDPRNDTMVVKKREKGLFLTLLRYVNGKLKVYGARKRDMESLREAMEEAGLNMEKVALESKETGDEILVPLIEWRFKDVAKEIKVYGKKDWNLLEQLGVITNDREIAETLEYVSTSEGNDTGDMPIYDIKYVFVPYDHKKQVVTSREYRWSEMPAELVEQILRNNIKDGMLGITATVKGSNIRLFVPVPFGYHENLETMPGCQEVYKGLELVKKRGYTVVRIAHDEDEEPYLESFPSCHQL